MGLAYSPKAESGLAKFLFGGPGKTSIRAGAGMYYDEIGQPLAQTINANAFGLATTLTTPPNVLTTAQLPRFTTFYTVPSAIVPAPGPSGLGAPYPTSGAGSFAITSSLDDKLKAPYTMNLNFSIGRDFSHGFFVQVSYVGRLSRNTLTDRDMAAYTNLKDPKSGQTFYQAMHQLATMIDYQGVSIANLPKIPFFENMWPAAAGHGFTSTQVWAKDYYENNTQGDFSDVLNDFDNAANCNPGSSLFSSSGGVNAGACGAQGPWMMFNPQFSALAAWSSIGKGDYHAMQWTIRKSFSSGLQFDLNYTWSKSIDLGSARESDAGTGNSNFAGDQDFVQNAWNPSQMRGVSAYDTTHQINGFVVYQLPFGRGKKFGSQMSKALDAFVGGWQISAAYRQTSGFPTSAINGQRWPTDWEVDALGTPNGQPRPPVTNNKNAPGPQSGVAGGPNLWSDPAAAFASYGETMAGETGSRNTLRGSGIFNIDTRRQQDLHDAMVGTPEVPDSLGDLQSDQHRPIRSECGEHLSHFAVEFRPVDQPVRRAAPDAIRRTLYLVARSAVPRADPRALARRRTRRPASAGKAHAQALAMARAAPLTRYPKVFPRIRLPLPARPRPRGPRPLGAGNGR